MNKYEILVIDDEPEIQRLLEITLESNGYLVRQAVNAKQGMLSAASHPPSLILLDLGLPDRSGQELLKELRMWFSNPIIILSVLDNEIDIVTALDQGASDYITKPFRSAELLARIRSAIKRSQVVQNTPTIDCGDLHIDVVSRIVRKNDTTIKLTSTEFNLLVLLAKNEGRVLTHRYILKEIWGPGHQTETQYLRVFIGTLRKKIESNPDSPSHIQTESGVGYRFI